MSDVAIKVNGLGKQYVLGGSRRPYKTMRESLVSALRMSFGNGKRGGSSRDERSFWALKDVNFEVNRGEVVGIIGRNGAGKSTLLKILSRITDPTEGEVDVIGRVGSLLEVGTGFHPELTGRENIFLNGAILGMKRGEIAAKFDEIVGFAETEKFLDTQVKHYSSGMYMRLAFAVAAHLEPEILVVDEVLAVGDAEFQKKCLGKMSEVADQGRTVLFVSHNMNAVESLCKSVLLLDQGHIREHGNDVRGIISRYMFGDDSSSRATLWTNPSPEVHAEWFLPTKFGVTNEAGMPLPQSVRNDAEMFVHIEGTLFQTDPAFNVGYAMFNEDGYLLYWSLTTDSPPDQWARPSTGSYVFRSRIPPRFLNEGDFRLEMIASLHHRQWLVQPGANAPSVIIRIRGGLSDSPYWMTRRPGVMAPEIPWTCKASP